MRRAKKLTRWLSGILPFVCLAIYLAVPEEPQQLVLISGMVQASHAAHAGLCGTLLPLPTRRRSRAAGQTMGYVPLDLICGHALRRGLPGL